MFSISSSHWLGIWAGLEINLIGFLPILVYQKTRSETESAVKYFIVQALGSRLLIFGSLLRASTSFTWELSSPNFLFGIIIVTAGLITKIGIFPFHYWLPRVIAGLPWLSCILLATWQKVAPLFLVSSLIELSQIYSLILILCFLARISSLVGGLGGINQTQIRAILAYSSIGHLGWILFASCHRSWTMKTYFLIYTIISLSLFSTLWLLNTSSIKRLRNLVLSNTRAAFTLIIIMLSLAGLPPLVGFISKWVVILSTTLSVYWLLVFILLLGSVISLFYYLTLYFSILLSLNSSSFFNSTDRKSVV